MRYAAYGKNGIIEAFYHKADSPPPEDVKVIEITDKEWAKCLSEPGWKVVKGKLKKVKA